MTAIDPAPKAHACDLDVRRTAARGATVSRAAAERLGTHRDCTFRAALGGGLVATRDIPLVRPADVAHLDERGWPAVGTALRPPMLLFGRVHEVEGVRRDASLRVPAGTSGAVVGVVEERADGGGSVVHVHVREPQPLRLGDSLAVGAQVAVVSAIVEELEGDVLFPGVADEGVQHVARHENALDVLQARFIGPYDPRTQRPTTRKLDWGGQWVGESEQWALEVRGAWRTLHELTTYKSDDPKGRTRAYHNIGTGIEELAGNVPAGTLAWFEHLRAMGFVPPVKGNVEPDPTSLPGALDVRTATDADIRHALDGARPKPDPLLSPLSLSLATDRAIREQSCGEVTMPDSVHPATGLPFAAGLHSARIFGALEAGRCECGATREHGAVCGECGVKVESPWARRERYGHIELATPVIHPLAVDAIAGLLGIGREAVERAMFYEGRLFEDPELGSEWSELEETGAGAVLEALRALDLAALCESPDPVQRDWAKRFQRSRTRPEDLVSRSGPYSPRACAPPCMARSRSSTPTTASS